MGLFDKVFGQEKGSNATSEPFTQQEAFAAIALAASAADGNISETEYGTIRSYLGRMRLYEAMNDYQFQTMSDKLFKILRKEGPSGLIARSTESLPDDLKQTAFACAVDIALADGSVEESEKQLLEELNNALKIPENIAKTIIQVMIIKNRG